MVEKSLGVVLVRLAYFVIRFFRELLEVGLNLVLCRDRGLGRCARGRHLVEHGELLVEDIGISGEHRKRGVRSLTTKDQGEIVAQASSKSSLELLEIGRAHV